MAHTCTQCCEPWKIIVAPAITDEDSCDLISGRPTKRDVRRLNLRYRHDHQSWKAATKAPK